MRNATCDKMLVAQIRLRRLCVWQSAAPVLRYVATQTTKVPLDMKKLMLIGLMALPMTVHAHDYKVGDLAIAHPIARATTATAMSSAGYFEVTNTGDVADRLIEVRADFPRVMMHDTKIEDDIATMFHVDAVEIGAGETVTFMPGGKHVMFMGLNGDPFEVGEKVPATLVFENAGTVEITFNVEEIKAMHNH